MNKFRGKNVVVVSAAVAMALGMASSVAFATTTQKNPPAPFGMRGPRSFGGDRNLVAALGSALGVDVATLQADFKAGKTVSEIATEQGVSSSTLISKMESSLESQLTSRVDHEVSDFVNGTKPPMMHGNRAWGRGMGQHNNIMTALASDLKLTTSTLQSDLKFGKTIAELASAQGVSTSSLISELESTLQSQLAQAQASGKISSAVESKMAARIDTQVTDFVNGTKPPMMHDNRSWGPRMGQHNNMMTALASDLKLTTSTLQSDLKSGKTIAEIASAQGISTSSLISELESTLQSQLVKNVQNEVVKFVASTVPPHIGWTKSVSTSQTNSLNSD